MAHPHADGSGAMFDQIAPRYDLLNRLMSLGLDRRWRRLLVRSLALGPAAGVLDVATGTGDVALAIARAHGDATVVGIDPSVEMLAVARGKVASAGLEGAVRLVEGDAQRLPFGDDFFSAACISFGIRNVPDRELGLREMARVTRPGGVVAVLELGEPRDSWLAPAASWHAHRVVPRMGALISGAEAYDYLSRSVAAFPPAAEFAGMMEAAGLTGVTVRPLGFGAAHLYVSRVAG